MKKKSKILVILGVTAIGKTDLALKLAKKFNGELVACDSRQIYKGLDIGTGKEVSDQYEVLKREGYWEVNGLKVWMYDFLDPKDQLNLKDYVDKANLVIEDILKRGKLPIIVGGTGLYLRGLLQRVEERMGVDKKIRSELEELTVGELQSKLKSLSPTSFEKINLSDIANKRRLVRKIKQSMYPYTGAKKHKSKIKIQNWDVLKIGLTAPRSIINQKIDSRLNYRFSQGLIEEGEDLLKNGLSLKRLRELGLEYGILADHFEGKIKKEEVLVRLMLKNHQYAKRQQTWFKKEDKVNWFDVTREKPQSVERLIDQWYHPLA